MAFKDGDRVRLKETRPGSSWTGVVVDPVNPLISRKGRRYAVRWDGSNVTVPGYRADELEGLS